MTQISRIFTLSISLLVLTAAGFAQERGERQNRPGGNRDSANRPDIASEEWRAEQSQIIINKTQNFMKKMGDAVPDDKKEAVTTVVREHLIGELKLKMSMISAQAKANGDREKMRNLRMAIGDKMKALAKETNAKAKTLLDKKSLRVFSKNLEQMFPPMSGPGGGGRGGPGGGGGGGRGGQGGGGGGGR